MANTQYPYYPAGNWSSEISAPQSVAHASATTSTTTTTTSSSSSGHSGAAPYPAGGAAASAPLQGQGVMMASGWSAAPQEQSPSAPQSETPAVQGQTAVQNAAPPAVRSTQTPARSEFEGSSGVLNLETRQPIEVIEAPASMNEAFLGSLKSMLLRNKGAFVTATFLIGTQGTTTWEGILHDVGNDYIIIFQPGRQRYIASDIYSLKYIEFYDTKQREVCEHLLRENGMKNF